MPKPVKPPHAKKAQKSGKPGAAPSGRVTPKATGRYTPPVPRATKVSPIWVPILMFTFLGLGAAVIFCNYLGLVPGDTSNVYLLIGLGLILAGIITATNYH